MFLRSQVVLHFNRLIARLQHALHCRYGDVIPVIEREMAFTAMLMVTGLFFFGFIVASITANLANADKGRVRFQEKINSIRNYMEVR